ncbi:enoyl-ACP reductase FabI [Thalassobaculum sp.]|uniref:enoyl-ACP reductase FabI n=1 Tax=Thalassobaculum sp. TaxID=2022740 RepID=UPI003B599641
MGTSLRGKKGLVVGIANDQSIAYGCARAFREAGADLAVTYLNDKARPHTEPLSEALGAELFLPCDVREEGQVEALFQAISDRWGRLDFLLHSIAFAPREDLHGRVTDCSRAGFDMAMNVSCHSFIRMARHAEPLMTDGGALMTMSYYGAEKVVDRYNLMGPVKAALEASVRYLAVELGQKNIRVYAVSPGPLKTRAASGIDRFDELMDQAASRAPNHALVTIEQVGNVAAFLASGAAAGMTGNVVYVDNGYNVVG